MQNPDSPQLAKWLATLLSGAAPTHIPDSKEEWQKLTQAADWNGVTALLDLNLNKLKEHVHCPDYFIEEIRNRSRQLAARELMQIQQVRVFISSLFESGIQPLLLKGTPLAYSIYPEPYLRERCDTDIMFENRKQAEQGWLILQEMGYERFNAMCGEFVSSQFSCTKTSKIGISHTFDMHWKISNTLSVAHVIDFEELSAKAIPVPRIDKHALTLSNSHAFLLACIHRMTNIKFGIANRLIWLYDIHLIAESMREKDWADASSLARDKGVESMIKSGVEETSKYFPTPLPNQFEAQLRSTTNKGNFQPEAVSHDWQLQLMDIKSLPNLSAKLKFIKETLLPPADYIKAKFGTNSTLSLPYYYCLRVAQGIPKLFKRHR